MKITWFQKCFGAKPTCNFFSYSHLSSSSAGRQQWTMLIMDWSSYGHYDATPRSPITSKRLIPLLLEDSCWQTGFNCQHSLEPPWMMRVKYTPSHVSPDPVAGAFRNIKGWLAPYPSYETLSQLQSSLRCWRNPLSRLNHSSTSLSAQSCFLLFLSFSSMVSNPKRTS